MLLLQGPRGWLYERLCGLLLGPRVLLLLLAMIELIWVRFLDVLLQLPDAT